MATLAEIRRRIASVKNTQQITRALQAVAASKLRRVQAQAEAARPYADRMADVLVEVASRVTTYKHPFLTERPVKKRLLILVSSDRGLAGGLNVNAFRVALGYIRQGETVLDTIGRKGRDYFRRLGVPILAEVSGIGDRPQLKDILPTITVARDEYLQGNVDEVGLVYTHFASVRRPRRFSRSCSLGMSRPRSTPRCWTTWPASTRPRWWRCGTQRTTRAS